MKQLKKPRTGERDVITRGNHKKTSRPWVLQYQWISPEEYEKNGPLIIKGEFSPEWQQRFGKYIDLDHAEKQLNKDLRTRFSWFSRSQGRNWRVYNKETSDTRLVEIVNTRVRFKDEFEL